MQFQLCARGKKFPNSEMWLYEPKIDGLRLAIVYEKEGFAAFGRGGHRFSIPKHIVEALPSFFEPGTFLDGEFCHGKDHLDAYSVIGRENPPSLGQFFVFDCVFGENDYETLEKRKKRIAGAEMVNLYAPVCSLIWWPYKGPETAEKLYKLFLENGFEGLVAKRIDSHYTPGRRNTWLKFKPGRENAD